MTVPRNNNNQENTNNPFQAAGSLFGGALEEILANTDVRIGPDGIRVEVNQDSACPPLLGDPAPPGCDKTFADDGDIPCWDDTDCPVGGRCDSGICYQTQPPCDSGQCPESSVGSSPDYTRSYQNVLNKNHIIIGNSASVLSALSTDGEIPALTAKRRPVLVPGPAGEEGGVGDHAVTGGEGVGARSDGQLIGNKTNFSAITISTIILQLTS